MNIGIIGAGDMGSMYARKFAAAGYDVAVSDLPWNRLKLEEKFDGTGIKVLNGGKEVAKRSDVLLFGVETDKVERVVAQHGPYARRHAIVGGLTSVKSPETSAFSKYLPNYAHAVTLHSLHGPRTDPVDGTLGVMDVRSRDGAYNRAMDTYKALGYQRIVEISTKDHDRITADTQVLTHVGFQSLGTMWKKMNVYPWEHGIYSSGIDGVKALIALRLFGTKPHINAGLAFHNPFAGRRVDQYDKSVQELFELMLQGKEAEIRKRLKEAGEDIFAKQNRSLLLDDRILNDFNFGTNATESHTNSHLMLLASVDAWHKLGTNPYDHLICETPNFRLRLGLAEYLFRNEDMLEKSIDAFLSDGQLKVHDFAFSSAVREWATTIRDGINYKDPRPYFDRFERTGKFFSEWLDKAQKKSDEMITHLAHVTRNNNAD